VGGHNFFIWGQSAITAANAIHEMRANRKVKQAAFGRTRKEKEARSIYLFSCLIRIEIVRGLTVRSEAWQSKSGYNWKRLGLATNDQAAV